MSKLTILADENIAHLSDYLNHHDIDCHFSTGRAINRALIDRLRPDALLVRSVTPVDENLIKDSSVQFVATATIGTDHIDKLALKKFGISFASAAGCSKHSVAQYVISAILSCRPEYVHKKITLGILGLGNIGSTLADYAKHLDWEILAYDPFLPASKINNSCLDTLLSNSDVISIHTPLTTDGAHPTHQLFNHDRFYHIQPHTLLINSARGEILCQDALLDAIDKKKLQVVLDVFPFEPNIDTQLLNKLSLATPHIAGYSLDGRLRGTDMIYQALCAHFNLPMCQSMDALITPSPLHWQQIHAELLDGLSIEQTYCISKDDAALRACVQGAKVVAAQFDALRKNYPLRREWVF